MVDPDEFIDAYARFLRDVVLTHRNGSAEVGGLTRTVNEHLGTDSRSLAVVTEVVPPGRLVDADLALGAMSGDNGSIVGLSGPGGHGDTSFGELLRGDHGSLDTGPVGYVSLATGPDTERQVVAVGVRLLTYEGSPIAVLQRDASPHWGRDAPTLEVLAADQPTTEAFLAEVRRLMLELSVLRGQVVTFSGSPYESQLAGLSFQRRPQVDASDVVLPAGTLDRLVRHAVLIGEQRETLRAVGQHLKRGILLYGPPGTGKTHSVRYLLSRTPGTTAILLSGNSLRLVSTATKIARAMQPAIVVLEDCDLVAEDRDMVDSPDSMLFELLEALDGLDSDADVAFVMTTNRPDLLERALVQRPGRVDLAVEIPLPDAEARRALFALYGRGLRFSADALDVAADRAEGVTASFAKELARRAVLSAAFDGRDAGDEDLDDALEELLSDRESLTRSLLASGPRAFDGGPDERWDLDHEEQDEWSDVHRGTGGAAPGLAPPSPPR